MGFQKSTTIWKPHENEVAVAFIAVIKTMLSVIKSKEKVDHLQKLSCTFYGKANIMGAGFELQQSCQSRR